MKRVAQNKNGVDKKTWPHATSPWIYKFDVLEIEVYLLMTFFALKTNLLTSKC